jgi:hypothetical protein
MATGQSPIVISTNNALSTEGTTNNVATNKAALKVEQAASANGKDITPTSVRTNSMYVTEGVISEGLMRSGSLLVGSGGVAITSDPDGGTPSGTGLLMSDSMLALTLTGETNPVVLLNGQDGSASFKGTVSAGSTVSAAMTAGSIYAGSGGVSISSDAAGAEPTGHAGIYIGYLSTAPVLKLTDATGATTVLLNGSDGNADFTGDIVCNSLIASDSNAVDFGHDITISGNIYMQSTDASDGYIYWDKKTSPVVWTKYNTTDKRLEILSGGADGSEVGLQAGASGGHYTLMEMKSHATDPFVAIYVKYTPATPYEFNLSDTIYWNFTNSTMSDAGYLTAARIGFDATHYLYLSGDDIYWKPGSGAGVKLNP